MLVNHLKIVTHLKMKWSIAPEPTLSSYSRRLLLTNFPPAFPTLAFFFS